MHQAVSLTAKAIDRAPNAPATRIGILAVAKPRNGGTLPYTLSMIDALRRLPANRYSVTLFTTCDNHQYDHLDLPIVAFDRLEKLALRRLSGYDPFGSVDKVVAPVYSTLLLATARPFVFTLHDLQEKYFPEHFSPSQRLWRHTTNRLLTARASRIICESNFVRSDIVRFFGVRDSRIAVVPAPPAASLVNGNGTHHGCAKFNLPDEFVFYPAQFWPHKNHLRLVEAFAKVAAARPQCALVLTGQERLEFGKVMARARELGIADRIRHVGHVDQDAMSALYRRATVVAVPTLFESISLPVYEAFAAGAAVCASNVVALPEQIGDAGLLFDPLSPDGIASSILRLLDSPDLRRSLAERGRRRIAAMTHDDYAKRLAGIIDAV